MEPDARNLLKEANELREQENFEESLNLFNQALLQAAKVNDLESFVESIAGRSITLRHLAAREDSSVFLMLAENELHAAIKIAQKHDLKKALALPYHQLGSVLEKQERFEEAVDAYEKAVDYIEHHAPSFHDRPAVKADFKIHLYTAKYKKGEKSALEEAQKALKQLEESDEESYTKNVWLVGAHMRLAEILKEDQTKLAKEHLTQAKQIIDSDSRLTLRHRQWDKLAQSFN